MSGLLDQLELEIKDRLESFPFFATLEVHADPQKNIVDEITTKIAKLKTLIAPLVSRADDLHPNVPGVYFDGIQFEVAVFQNPLLKGNDPSPRTICEEIHSALKHWTPDSLSNVVTPRTPGIEQVADRKLNIWNSNFETKGGFIAAMSKVATPGAVAAAGSVTLTCATAGAAMFYTTDGSKPAPLNGTLYLAPFVSAGQTVKARAFLAGYLHSDIRTINT